MFLEDTLGIACMDKQVIVSNAYVCTFNRNNAGQVATLCWDNICPRAKVTVRDVTLLELYKLYSYISPLYKLYKPAPADRVALLA